MGECLCDGPGDCKTCGMRILAQSFVDVTSKKYKTREEVDKEIEKLGFKKADKNSYVVNSYLPHI